MMNGKAHVFVIGVILAMTVVLNTWGGGGQSSASGSGGAVDRSNFNALGTFPVVKTKETINVMARTEGADLNYDTNWMTKFYEEKTNVHVNWITAPVEQFKERVNLSLASGEALDLIVAGGASLTSFSQTEVLRLAEQGLILPLQDLIETDTIYFKQRLNEAEGWRQAIALPNGNIYTAPYLMGDYHTYYYGKMWVNKEFLNNVNLKVPTTIDEFHTMLTAFKTRDANGNGDPNDEIPLMGAKDNYGSRIDTFLISAYVYDDGENRLYIDNGKVVAAFTRPEFQEGLRTLNQWFREGLIARETFTATRNDRSQINSAKYESIIGAMPNFHALNFGSRESGQPVRWIDYEPIAPLKGPRGLQVTRYDHYFKFQTTNPSGFIPATCKNPALIMRWLDWFMTEEGTLTVWLGGKGVGRDDPDPGAIGAGGGPAAYKSLTLEPGDPYYGNVSWGQQFPHFRDENMYFGWQKAEAGGNMLNPDGSGLELFLIQKTRENYAPYGQAVDKIIPPLYYTGDGTEMAMLTTNINTYVEESIAKFVVGDLSIDRDWTAFQNNLKNLGLDRYLQIIQNSYDTSPFAKK
jgi:putative aldouronate transport system substrate-binding protein